MRSTRSGSGRLRGGAPDRERLETIRRLTDDDHEFGDTERRGNVIEALIKPVGVVEGISDVPWHKDCSSAATRTGAAR